MAIIYNLNQEIRNFWEIARRLSDELPDNKVDPTSVDFENLLAENPALEADVTASIESLRDCFADIVVALAAKDLKHKVARAMERAFAGHPLHFEWDKKILTGVLPRIEGRMANELEDAIFGILDRQANSTKSRG